MFHKVIIGMFEDFLEGIFVLLGPSPQDHPAFSKAIFPIAGIDLHLACKLVSQRKKLWPVLFDSFDVEPVEQVFLVFHLQHHFSWNFVQSSCLSK